MSEVDDNKAELLDDDVITTAYPPDAPMAVDERLTAIEEQSGETARERALREDEREDLAEPVDADLVGTLVAPDEGAGFDYEGDEVAYEVAGYGSVNSESGSGWGSTTQDEEEELSAEEDAMHLTAAPPMGDGDGYIDDEL